MREDEAIAAGQVGNEALDRLVRRRRRTLNEQRRNHRSGEEEAECIEIKTGSFSQSCDQRARNNG